MRFSSVLAIVVCALCACGGRTRLSTGSEHRTQTDGGGIVVDAGDTRDASGTKAPPAHDASTLDNGSALDAGGAVEPLGCGPGSEDLGRLIALQCLDLTRPGLQGTCVDGHCEYACAENAADCNDDLADGCEVELKFDEQNCGACGTVCADDLVCSYGACEPPRALHAIAVGGNMSCALRHDGELSCWGDNSSGQLGLGDKVTDTFAEPQVVDASLHFIQVSVGDNHACGIVIEDDSDVTNGGLYCWGRGGEKLGDRGRETCADGFECASAPKPIFAGFGVSRVVAGGTFTCGISRVGDGVVMCWGDNDHGQLGRGYLGPDDSFFAPVLTADGTPLSGVLDIAVGRRHACARTAIGIACWGDNRSAQLGDAQFGDAPITNIQVCDDSCSSHAVFLPAFDGVRVLEIDATSDFTCALSAHDDGNRVACWGANQRGQLGRLKASISEAVPEAIAFEGGEPTAMGVGGEFACAALDNDSHLEQCWGDNAYGQLGYPYELIALNLGPLPMQADSSIPMPPQSVDLDFGLSHGCAQATGEIDPLMRCWGHSTEGQVGGGWEPSVTAPRTVPLCAACECGVCFID